MTSQTVPTQMTPRFRAVLFLLAAVAFFALASHERADAQSYEEQAAEILKLFHQGQTDTAYWLIEPLKRNARFVPAALYVRAEMTPDDRALNLYREAIALDPTGAWADDAAFQLVRRYVQKRDSIAAATWLSMLTKHFPSSPHVAAARTAILGVNSWSVATADAAEPSMSNPQPPAVAPTPAAPEQSRTVGRQTAAAEDADDSKMTPASQPPMAPSNISIEDFSGYALQVGLFPSRERAEVRVHELRTTSLRPIVFPKDVNGRTQYALVVGPYKSIEAATAAKPLVSRECECQAFAVLVE